MGTVETFSMPLPELGHSCRKKVPARARRGAPNLRQTYAWNSLQNVTGVDARAAGSVGGRIADQHDVDSVGAVRTEHESLLDVGSARWTGNKIQRARHEIGAVLVAQ